MRRGFAIGCIVARVATGLIVAASIVVVAVVVARLMLQRLIGRQVGRVVVVDGAAREQDEESV